MKVLNNPLVQGALRRLSGLTTEPFDRIQTQLSPVVLAGDATHLPWDEAIYWAFSKNCPADGLAYSMVGVENPADSGYVIVVDLVTGWISTTVAEVTLVQHYLADYTVDSREDVTRTNPLENQGTPTFGSIKGVTETPGAVAVFAHPILKMLWANDAHAQIASQTWYPVRSCIPPGQSIHVYGPAVNVGVTASFTGRAYRLP